MKQYRRTEALSNRAQKAAKLSADQERDIVKSHGAYLERSRGLAQERARILANLQAHSSSLKFLLVLYVKSPFSLAIIICAPAQLQDERHDLIRWVFRVPRGRTCPPSSAPGAAASTPSASAPSSRRDIFHCYVMGCIVLCYVTLWCYIIKLNNVSSC